MTSVFPCGGCGRDRDGRQGALKLTSELAEGVAFPPSLDPGL